jgi:hypothetical protein
LLLPNNPAAQNLYTPDFGRYSAQKSGLYLLPRDTFNFSRRPLAGKLVGRPLFVEHPAGCARVRRRGRVLLLLL